MKPVFANAEEAKWGGGLLLALAVIILVAIGYENHEFARRGLMIMAGFGGFIAIQRLVHVIWTGLWN